MKKGKIVSIFSGIDAFSLGFREYFDTVLAIEIEKMACATLEYNKDKFHPNLTIINSSVTDVPDEFISKYKGVTGIIGGPPCQAFSSASGTKNKKKQEEAIVLLDHYIKFVRIIQPKFFVFENVPGLLITIDKRKIFENLITSLKSLGYKVQYKILNAHDYGNAQKRERIIVVGLREDTFKDIDFMFPAPVADIHKKYVRDILDVPNNVGEHAPMRPDLKGVFELIPEGGCWRHLPSEDLKMKVLGGSYWKRSGGMTGVARRLNQNKPCPTIMASGPGQRQSLLGHPLENRLLSVTEFKRACGIPDEYKILGSRTLQYRFTGNAVPVELANAIAKQLFEII